MRPADPQLPDVFTRSRALRAGLTAEQVRHRGGSGAWRILRRGTYCLGSTWDRADDRTRRVLSARAGVVSLAGDLWVSHGSAAAVHGLPVPVPDPGVYLTRVPPGRTRYLDGLTVEVATLRPADRWDVQGLAVTSPARTVADCLRHLRPRDGLAVLDAALAGSPDLGGAVRVVLEQCAEWPYAGRAGAVLALGDARRESPLESWSAWEMHVHGVPLPVPQHVVRDRFGTFVARVDFWWPEHGVVGEADGLVKYDAPDGLSGARDALVAEKRREDALRALGLDVVRWGARDLASPQWWARDLKLRLERARQSRMPALAVAR